MFSILSQKVCKHSLKYEYNYYYYVNIIQNIGMYSLIMFTRTFMICMKAFMYIKNYLICYCLHIK